ncbi:MAG TPA: hypothetical protein DCS97_09580 [Planctomycetes bacterium]|nr:hypothetical protein [Planctomycetota bacterium]
MATRKIRPLRKTRHLLPFAPDSATARSYRPTEVLQPMPPAAEPTPATSAGGITIEGEQVFPPAPPEASRQRHQSQDNLQLEKKNRRQTRNLAGRGWT